MPDKQTPETRPWNVKDVIDSLYGFIGIYTLDGVLVEANQAPLDAAGLAREDVIGLPVWETYWWSFSSEVQDQLRAALAKASKGEQVRYETPIRMQEGALNCIDITFGPLRDSSGKIAHVIGSAVDITEQKASVEALNEQRDFTTDLLETAPVIVVLMDVVGDIEHVNSHFLELTGYQLPEVQGVEWFSTFLPERDRDSIREMYRTAIQGTPVGGYVNPIVTRSGEERQIEWHARRRFDKDGQVIGLLSIGHDVTARMAAELDIKANETLLREAQKLSHIGVWELNVLTGALHWSDEIFNMFEIDSELFGASYDAFLNGIHPDDRERVNEAYQNSLETKQQYKIQHRLLMADGRVKHVVENYETQYGPEGNAVRSLGTIQDVTERIMLEEELRRSKNEADDANMAKSEFLSRMSHELRTPLNVILGFSQVLNHDETSPLNETQSQHLNEIERAGEHLLDLVNEVLELSQIESGHVNLNMESVNLGEALRDTLALARSIADQSGIAVRAEMQGLSRVWINADRVRLKQILLNLLSNAVKYNRANGLVSVKCEPGEYGLIRISVSDTGAGIADDMQQYVFEPFNRLDNSDSEIEGTGIGLAITKRLIEAMGGNIGFESTPGVGSSFWVELALADAREVEGEEPFFEIGQDLSLPAMVDGASILYIEDNPANLRLLEVIIEKVPGITLLSAHTAELGLEVARYADPKLILMDINLPGMDGITARENLLENEATKHIPVVAVSADAMPYHKERAMNAGFQGYLTKPLRIQELLDLVKDYVQPANNILNLKSRG